MSRSYYKAIEDLQMLLMFNSEAPDKTFHESMCFKLLRSRSEFRIEYIYTLKDCRILTPMTIQNVLLEALKNMVSCKTLSIASKSQLEERYQVSGDLGIGGSGL